MSALAEAITGAAETLRDISSDEATLVALMDEIRSADDGDRHAMLIEWVRSDWWHPALMLCTGWQGAMARSALRALQIDLSSDTPARTWAAADYAVGRGSIARLLGVEDEPCAAYATAAFKTFIDPDGRSWIAGAVGCPPHLDAERLSRWRHTDITDVILWDPRTSEARLAGEHRATSHLILPHVQDDQITVFGDAGAFFRAWAERRARLGALAKHAPEAWPHPVAESRDSELPGGLVIGSLEQARWAGVTAPTVVAGPGVSKTELRIAALRSARLPIFTEAADAGG